jgi:hypothetical protein
MKRSIVALVTIVMAVLFAAAQTNTPRIPAPTHFPEPNIYERMRRERELGGPLPRRSVGVPVAEDLSKMPALTADELKELMEASPEARFIPPTEYIKKYYSYVTSDTLGMARLFPDRNCGEGGVVTLAELERCADVPQRNRGGSLYSFRSPGLWSLRKNAWILRLADGKFGVGNEIVQGVIADIGEADMEKIDLEHKAFKFLSGYDPKQKIQSIREQNIVLAAGIAANGYTFTNAAPVKAGSTYALRSVLYRYREEGAPMPRRGFDQYIVFKAVGQEPDGSVIIIWKELKREFPRRRLEK